MSTTATGKNRITWEEWARRLAGIGQPWLKPGDDPIADLIRERVAEDKAHTNEAWATSSAS